MNHKAGALSSLVSRCYELTNNQQIIIIDQIITSLLTDLHLVPKWKTPHIVPYNLAIHLSIASLFSFIFCVKNGLEIYPSSNNFNCGRSTQIFPVPKFDRPLHQNEICSALQITFSSTLLNWLSNQSIFARWTISI